MTSPTLEIRPFTPDLLPQVAELLRYLWSADAAANQRVFLWKYDENPCRAAIPGVVAVREGRVVGFRGYFATAWTVSGRSEPVRILCPGDTCVDPIARQAGLSVAMGQEASRCLAGEAPLLLNTTSTHASLPGYRKLGFVPLADKAYRSAYGILGLARYILAYSRRPAPDAPRAPDDEQPGFAVTSTPRPEEMAALATRGREPWPGLAPLRTPEYFHWRFRRPGGAYTFYYAYADGELQSYLVVGLSPNRRRGYLLDFLDADGSSLAGLLARVLDRRDLDILSVAAASAASSSLDWQALGFRSNGLLRRLERRRTGELPLLLRPTAASFDEPAWRVGGVDAREPRNWCYREMVSDAF